MPWPAANNLEFVTEPMASRAGLTRETRASLRRTIAGLPEHLRTVLVLYYARECSLAECGAVLDVPASRVSQMLAEARARLRRALQLADLEFDLDLLGGRLPGLAALPLWPWLDSSLMPGLADSPREPAEQPCPPGTR